MKKIDRVLKQLSDLYECNRKIRAYQLRKKERVNNSVKRDVSQDRHTPQPTR
jgi:hypothetical protein